MPVIDNNGLIASKSWSGDIDRGDTLAETGRIYFLKKLCNIEDGLMKLEKALLLLEDDHGNWRRSPQQWTDPKDVSRDQLDPMIMCLAIYGRNEYVASEYEKHRARWFRYPNGDLSSPEHLNHFTRHLTKSSMLGDLFMLLNSSIICLSGSRVQNDLNHIISLCHAEFFRPTVLSRRAAKLYLKKRDYKNALMQYYTPQSGNGDLIQYYLEGLKWLEARVNA